MVECSPEDTSNFDGISLYENHRFIRFGNIFVVQITHKTHIHLLEYYRKKTNTEDVPDDAGYFTMNPHQGVFYVTFFSSSEGLGIGGEGTAERAQTMEFWGAVLSRVLADGKRYELLEPKTRLF